jgi:two-component system response regulator MprA
MYLRRKTEAGGMPRVVHTVRGVGYVLRAPDGGHGVSPGGPGGRA